MANFIATSRSNYFHVKDEIKFREAMSEAGCDITKGNQSEKDTRLDDPFESKFVYMIYPTLVNDTGDWPSLDLDDNEIDMVEILQEHLPSGEVCILHTVGYEKLRYLNHGIVAFNSEGVIQHHSQESFYDELNRLGHKFTRAEY